MAVTAGPYTNAVVLLGSAGLDFTADTFKALLTDSSYTIAPDADTVVDDITGEISDPGYTTGGVTLADVTWTWNAPDNQSQLVADPLEWASIDTDVRYVVIYKDTGDTATSPLVFWIDLDEDQNPEGALLRIAWADGALVISIGSGA